MQEEYSFGEDSELMNQNDSDLYLNHVIGADGDLNSLNSIIADYFSTYQPVS